MCHIHDFTIKINANKHHIFHVTNTSLLNEEKFLASHPNCDLTLCLTTQIYLKWVSIREEHLLL